MNGPEDLAGTLRASLPDLRGKLTGNAPLKDLTWFRVGGPAEVLFEPESEEDLAYFLSSLPEDVPLMVIGLASNLLVRDGGVPGVVVRLARAFAAIEVEAGALLRAGAAAPDVKVARAAADAGVAGLAFLRGIPGAIGGALRMNAGAYGREIKDVFVDARALDRRGGTHGLSAAHMGFSYRHADAPADLIFIEAVLQGEPGDRDEILAQMDRITSERSETQPVNTRTGGSTFANPDGHKAWELIDKAGCRGMRVGGAQVSEKHCNFLVNTGDATAADLETLGKTVRERVREAFGIELRWEIQRVGREAG